MVRRLFHGRFLLCTLLLIERHRVAAWLAIEQLTFTFSTRIHRTQCPTTPRYASASSSDANDNKANNPPRIRKADGTYTARYLQDNGLVVMHDENGFVTARPPVYEKVSKAELVQTVGAAASQTKKSKSTSRKHNSAVDTNTAQPAIKEDPATVVPSTGFNVVLTHATADFDSLAAAVGLARLWTEDSQYQDTVQEIPAPKGRTARPGQNKTAFEASHVPTFVVLPRGAHPGVQRFLALHKHLFPIRSLKSLPDDLQGLNRLALVDAQRRDRLGPADVLLSHAKRVTVVDHHVDQDSDIPATDYVVDKVGSVSTLITERLRDANIALTEAEATLLALGIHADTGSLCFDSTTPRDANALAWCLSQGASQTAIAEHAHPSLSPEQQTVLTQTLVNVNSTVVHGVTLSTVLLTADGFINGLAAVAQDALELSSSDVFLLGLVYEAQSGGRQKTKTRRQAGPLLTNRLLGRSGSDLANTTSTEKSIPCTQIGPDKRVQRDRLEKAFDRKDVDNSGFLDLNEVGAALRSSGVICSPETLLSLFEAMDANGDGRIDMEEFIEFASKAAAQHEEQQQKKSTTLILIGRAKAGSNLKNVKLNTLLERFGGGGHSKAASATVRLESESEASDILQDLVDELVQTGLQKQLTVGDFMTAPVLSVKVDMTESQVEDLFTRYDVRALPVVDDSNDVIGLVTYKEVASAKQRLWNKEQKRLRREKEASERGESLPEVPPDRKAGTTVKAWMLQHIKTVESSKTMAEVEIILLENDVGCIPVVADGTNQLVGMVTRTDLLRQHRYYNTLHYHNKGFVNSIENRKHIIELRKRLKRFDDD